MRWKVGCSPSQPVSSGFEPHRRLTTGFAALIRRIQPWNLNHTPSRLLWQQVDRDETEESLIPSFSTPSLSGQPADRQGQPCMQLLSDVLTLNWVDWTHPGWIGRCLACCPLRVMGSNRFQPQWRPQPAKLPSFGGYSLETLPYLTGFLSSG